MTAWSVLTTNSSLQSGTAWEHLNAQQGGGLVVYGEQLVTLEDDIQTEILDYSHAELYTALESDLETRLA